MVFRGCNGYFMEQILTREAIVNRQSPIVLLTRPAAQSVAFAASLQEACPVRIVISEVLQIVLTQEFAQIPLEQCLIFTSARAVEAFDLHQVRRGHRAFCVGARTARAAQTAGCKAISADGDVEALERMILADPPQNAIYLCGEHTRGALDQKLERVCGKVERRTVYDQVAKPLNDGAQTVLQATDPVIAPVFSPRSAEILSEQVVHRAAPLFPVFISDAAVQAWMGPLPPHQVAKEPNAEAMLRAVQEAIVAGGWLEGRKVTG